MRYTTILSTVFAAMLVVAGPAAAQMGLGDMGKAATSAVGSAGRAAVDSAKGAATDAVSGATEQGRGAAEKVMKAKPDNGKAALAKECAGQADSSGLIGKALRKFVSSCVKSGGKS
jgi:hypothetical protein